MFYDFHTISLTVNRKAMNGIRKWKKSIFFFLRNSIVNSHGRICNMDLFVPGKRVRTQIWKDSVWRNHWSYFALVNFSAASSFCRTWSWLVDYDACIFCCLVLASFLFQCFLFRSGFCTKYFVHTSKAKLQATLFVQ